MKIEDLAYCGLYCPQCFSKAAAETRDMRHMANIPERYANQKAYTFEELACGGCKFDNNCGDCEIAECAGGRGFATCAECGEFPCEELLTFANDGVPHHKWALENLQRIREIGMDKWFDEFSQSINCPKCGARQSWYFTCYCGEEI